MELYLPVIRKSKQSRPKVIWTAEMIAQLYAEFPVEFNNVLAKKMGMSHRTLIRKARELSIDKIPGFLEIRRKDISSMATAAKPVNPNKGRKGWSVPGGENTRFKKGDVSVMAVNPEVVEKVRTKRNHTIKRERIRMALDLPRLTKLKLK